MRPLALAVMFLCLSAFVAADVAYWTVVGEDIEDVVNAANFAASMKGSVSVTFTGKTMEQAREDVITQSLDDAVVVFFDGNEATIMKGTREEFDLVAEAAEIYFDRLNFVTQTVPADETLLLGEPVRTPNRAAEPKLCTMEAKLCWDGSSVGRDPNNNCEFRPCPPEPEDFEHEPVVVDQREETEPEEEPEPEKPNVIVRIWRWFAGIFS